MDLIQAAVIGLGQSGIMLDLDPARDQIWTHCVGIDTHKDFCLSSVVDHDKTRKEIVLNKINQKAKIAFFSNTQDMINKTEPVLVSICTPTKYHLETVKQITKSPNLKYIFCEKPMGSSVEEAEAIISICKENEIVLATNYMRRWDKRYIEIKEIIAKQKYGKLLAINANGATALFTSASHLIDLMCYFAGKVKEVSGVLQTNYIRNVHDTKDPGANAFFRFENGTTGHLKASSKDPQHYMFELDMLFEKGRVEIRNDGEKIIISEFRNNNTSSGSDYLALKEEEKKTISNERMLDALTDIIGCKLPTHPKSNGNNALEVQKIIRAITNSSNDCGVFKEIG